MSRDVPLESLTVRVEELARRIADLEADLRANPPAVIAGEIRHLVDDVAQLSGEVKGLRRAVIAFALTVAASAVGFAITVILVFGGSP